MEDIYFVYQENKKLYKEYNFNENKIGVIGASSGAHLALMAAYSDNNEFIDDEYVEEHNEDCIRELRKFEEMFLENHSDLWLGIKSKS